MTNQELNAKIDGNFEHATKIMKSERLIDKYIRKLRSSQLDGMLEEAGETMDAVRLFESAHAMKGVCSNLGLDRLAGDANEITEEFRPGNARKLTDEETKARIAAVVRQYRFTVDCISEYEASV